MTLMVVTLTSQAREFIIDLNRPNTYAAVFEAGLHPRHANGAQETTIEVRPDTAVGFKLLQWNIPPVKAVWDFRVARDEKLSSIFGVVSDAWTKDEAYKIVAPLELALGGDDSTLARMRTWIDGYPDSSINGDTWGRKAFSEDKKISAAYYFRHSMQPVKPLSLSIRIQFLRPLKDSGFHEGVLKPPPGFEHLDISIDYTYGESGISSTNPSSAPNAQPTSTAQSPYRVDDAEQISHNISRWWLWLLLIVVLGLLWLLRKKRK